MSNKDEKRRIREAKKQAAKRREKIQTWLIRGALIVFIPLALLVLGRGMLDRAPVIPPGDVTASDHVRGNPEADVVITLYADFQCPACFNEYQIIARAWPRIQEQAQLVFRHFPLDIHRHAFPAARYAEAAGRQGRFWEMHDMLYARQGQWAVLDNATPVFNGYALELGLDMDQFEADLEDQAIREKILADQQGGIRAGVRGTPSMYINGRMVNNPRSSAELVSMVEEAQPARQE